MIFVCLLFSVIATAQQPNRKALQYYQQAQATLYADQRIRLFEKAIAKDKDFTSAYWALSQEWLRCDSTECALAVLQRIDRPDAPQRDRTRLYIAEVYFSQGAYDKAAAIAELVRDQGCMREASLMKTRCQRATEIMAHPVPFEPQKLVSVSTPYDDYFPSITADERIISTTVSTRNSGLQREENIYWSNKLNGAWQPSRPIDELNTPQNEGSQSFSADGRYMFYVACNRREGMGSCDIYYAIRMGDRWSLPINPGAPLNTEWWESNPSLSPTGDELFFVTNRNGNRDIWHCDVRMSESGLLYFSNPRSLGQPVNTNGDEFAPFIHADNKTLYFASDGHYGLGKSDIFRTRRNNKGTWSMPENLGYPINTPNEEVGFVVSASGANAYISSNRIDKDGQGLDIYEFALYHDARPDPMHFVQGRIEDADTHRPMAAYVEIFDIDSTKRIFESLSDSKTGAFTAYLPVRGTYGIDARKKGYLPHSGWITAANDTLVIALQPAKKGKTIILKNLYFAFNSAKIQTSSAREIAYLQQFLQQNKFVRIHITGHTDNVGTTAYNRTLSQNRASALKEALIALGIAPDRITVEGCGSTQPIDTNDTDEGRANNRRVEVTILENPAVK